MKSWDLTGNLARLAESFDTLQKAWQETSSQWDDPTSEKFRREYLDPLRPRTQRAAEAIRRMVDLLGQAHRDCSEP